MSIALPANEPGSVDGGAIAMPDEIPVEFVTGETEAAIPFAPNEIFAALEAKPETATSQLLFWLNPVAPYLTVAYFIGVVLMMLRLASGLWGGHKLRRATVPFKGEELLTMIKRQARQIGLKAAPAVALCKQISIPIVVGIFKPMILLPATLASGLSPDQLQALVTHELAHICRFDLIVNLFQRLIEAVLFFHPAVWFVSRRVSIERENAADDMVLAAGWRRANYADALVRMAELSTALRDTKIANRAAALAASGANVSDFKRRVLRLLGADDRPRLRLTRGGLIVFGLLLVCTAIAPTIVRSWSQPTSDATASDQGTSLEIAQQRQILSEVRRMGVTVYVTHVPRPIPVRVEKPFEFGDSLSNVTHGTRPLPVREASFWFVPDKAWPNIGRLASLEELEIVGSDLRGEQFRHIDNLRNLRRLGIENSQFTPLEMVHLAGLKQLEHLELMFTVFEESEAWRIEKVGEMTPAERQAHAALLSRPRIRRHIADAAILTDRALRHLRGMKRLKTLRLINTFITEEGLKNLENATSLEELEVGAVECSDESAELFLTMPSLRRLDLGGSVSDAFLARLTSLKNLEELEVWGDQITDEGAKQLARMRKLRRLEIRGNKLTDRGIEELSKLRYLEHLDLRHGADSVTDAALRHFRDMVPGCHVVLFQQTRKVKGRADGDEEEVPGTNGTAGHFN